MFLSVGNARLNGPKNSEKKGPMNPFARKKVILFNNSKLNG
jgi:hypothetical protein